MSEPSTTLETNRDTLLKAAVVVLGLLLVLYSVLVVQQVLAAVALFVWVFVVYLAWRFVRAHERIADAAERLVAHDDRALRPTSATDERTEARAEPEPNSPDE